MFSLKYETPSTWVQDVEALGTLDLLSDHAHCELKAAATMQALVAKNPTCDSIVRTLPRFAMEELEHFEMVEALLRERGGKLAEQDTSPYADGLHKGSRANRKSLLLDRLILSHIIEARSAERFYLLSEHLSDRTLAEFFGSLMPSESAHRIMFLRLAEGQFPAEAVHARAEELRQMEADLIASLPFEARIHSGPKN